MKKVFVIYSEILMSFFDWWFFDVLRIVQENEWHIWNPEEILDKKHVLFMQKYWFENLTWPWPDLELTSIKSQIGWSHRVKWLSPLRSACKMTQKTCVARHVCDFYFIVTFCDLTLTLTFLSMPFMLMQYPSWTFTHHFGWVQALCSPSNRPGAPKCENASLWHLTWPWPDTWP